MWKVLLLLFITFNAHAFTADCNFYFSPNGGATAASIRLINSAAKTIEVHSYKLSSKPIADAIIAATKRNIRVTMVIDQSQVNGIGSQLQALKAAGVTIYIDNAHSIQHNKVIIVDGTRFQTGSFNLSAAAETNNAENILICTSKVGSDALSANMYKHQSHSRDF